MSRQACQVPEGDLKMSVLLQEVRGAAAGERRAVRGYVFGGGSSGMVEGPSALHSASTP